MKQKKQALLRYQQGAAAIMFLLMLPVLVGFMFLSIEGGRYLRLKAEVADAAEVATLAVSAQSSMDEGVGATLAETYMAALVPDFDENKDRIHVGVTRIDCSDNPECTGDSLDEDGGFVEFQVSVTTDHYSWFPKSESNPFGFDEKVNFSSKLASRKYQGGAVDVILVADFSLSMYWDWSEAGGSMKIDILKEVVGDVVDKISEYTAESGVNNTIALVPFNEVTKSDSEAKCPVVQRVLGNDDKASAINTYNQLFEDKNECDVEYERGDFWTVNAGTKYEEIKSEIEQMYPNGRTAIFEGIIRGAQIAKAEGITARRLIIILSDGMDDGEFYGMDNSTFHAQLNELGYCEKIRTELNELPPVDGQNVQSNIAVIGIDYSASDDPNLQACTGEENITDARNKNHLYDIIISLIAEEIGHLHTLPSTPAVL